MVKRLSLVLLAMLPALGACGQGTARPAASAAGDAQSAVPPPAASAPEVLPGIEVLEKSGFECLKGKKIGLLTNPSGIDRKLRSTVDILFNAPDVELKVLFAPEHGVRGDVYAGGKLSDSVDEATGLPVRSLYGSTRTPTPEMLKGLDAVVYDIQDVGTRSYTFISSLGLLMRACGEQGVEVVVLDRPNPLGGEKVEGCPVEPGYFSFISQFSIPYVYGLTVGELAKLINEEGLNKGEKGDRTHVRCKLTVVPMEGWHRNMTFLDTGLPWVLPSPNIPYPQSALGYPSAGILGELGFVNIGVGYTLPFGCFAAEWIDADALKETLDGLAVPGVSFRTIHFKPTSGSDTGKLLHGVQYYFTDYEKAELTMVQFYVLQALHELFPGRNPFVQGKISTFDRVCGTDCARVAFEKSFKASDLRTVWFENVEAFKNLSKKYFMYE